MTNLLQIKPFIHNFIENNLDTVFSGKVYWLGERKNIPNYPYCLLSVIAESKDKRTSHHNGKLNYDETRTAITTRYKTCTVTVAIYNAWVENTYDDVDMDEAKEFTYEQIDCLEGEFENFPINKFFSVQNISPIRPLHEVVDGGYMYRYEFDLTIGYNEARRIDKEIGKEVVADFVVTNEKNTTIENNSVYIDGEDAINNDLKDKDYSKSHFEVTTDNNDNIVVEIT